MSPDALSIVGLVAVLLPTLYFLITSPTFLLAKFEDPIVTKLYRDLLSFDFKLTCIGAFIGTVALGVSGRPIYAMCLAVIGAITFTVRRWLLRCMDTEMNALKTGDPQAVRQVRKLHWRSMAYNATQFAALLATVPFIFASHG